MKTIIVVLLSVWCSYSLSAQIFDPERTAKRTESKVKSKVNQSIDRTIDKGLNEVFKKPKSSSSSSSKKPTASKSKSSNEVSTADANELESNEFIGSFRLEVETSEQGKVIEEESGEATYYFDKTKSACMPNRTSKNGEKYTYLFDLEQKTMTVIKESSSKKIAVIQNRPAIRITQKAANNKKMEVTKMASTQTFEGHKCTKTLIEDGEQVYTLWVAEDLPYNFRTTLLSATSESDELGLLSPVFNKVEGFPLRITVESKQEDKTIKINMRGIKTTVPEAKVFSTVGCEVTDLTK